MRFAILFAICLLGVASAHSLNREWESSQGAQDLSKRDINEVFDKLGKFAQTKTQQAMNQLRRLLDALFKDNVEEVDETTEHPLAKRGLFDALEKMNTAAQNSAKKVFDGLQKTISGIFAPFKKPAAEPASEDTTDRSIAKRDLFDQLERMSDKVQAHAQKAFSQLRKVFDELFKNHPDAHGIEIEIQDGEVVTERIIKRNIFDFFGELNLKLQDEAAKIFGQLGNKFGNIIKPDDHQPEDLDLDFDEDSTESSIEKRAIFDLLGSLNERFQDQSARFFNQFQKPSPPKIAKPHLPPIFGPPSHHGPSRHPIPHLPNPFAHKPAPPKPKPEEEVEEIEVVTSA